MKNSARNDFYKLIHIINDKLIRVIKEVRNTQLCWNHDDCSLVEYRNRASKAIADELQAFVDRVEVDKYSSDPVELIYKLPDYCTIDVDSAADHAEVLITYVYDKIKAIANAHAPFGKNHGAITAEDWKAAAEFVDYGKLAHDSIVHWNTGFHLAGK